MEHLITDLQVPWWPVDTHYNKCLYAVRSLYLWAELLLLLRSMLPECLAVSSKQPTRHLRWSSYRDSRTQQQTKIKYEFIIATVHPWTERGRRKPTKNSDWPLDQNSFNIKWVKREISLDTRPIVSVACSYTDTSPSNPNIPRPQLLLSQSVVIGRALWLSSWSGVGTRHRSWHLPPLWPWSCRCTTDSAGICRSMHRPRWGPAQTTTHLQG